MVKKHDKEKKKRKLAAKKEAKKLPSKKEFDKKRKEKKKELREMQKKEKKRQEGKKKGKINLSKAREMTAEGVKKPKEMKSDFVQEKAKKRSKELREKVKKEGLEEELKEKTERGELITALPSPYEGEKLVLRRQEEPRPILAVNVMRKGEKGEEKIGTMSTREREGQDKVELVNIRVAKPYRKEGVGTALESVTRQEIEKKHGEATLKHKNPSSRSGEEFWKERQFKEDVEETERKKELKTGGTEKTTDRAKKEIEGVIEPGGKEKKKVEPEEAVENIEKSKNALNTAEEMIIEGKIQRSNYEEVTEKLKKEGKEGLAENIEYIIEKNPVQ